MLLFFFFVCKSTLTPHSSILKVARVTANRKVAWTISEVTLTTTASNIVQIDWTSTNTKMSIAEGHYI